jgi:hypothetical protein
VEIARLQLGNVGNRNGHVSKLAMSQLLSFFPQLPALVYFGFYQEIKFTADFENIVAYILLLLLALEVIFGVITTRRFIKNEKRHFYNCCRNGAEITQKWKENNEAEIAYWSTRANWERDESKASS